MRNSKKPVPNSLSARVLRKGRFLSNRTFRDTEHFFRKTLEVKSHRDYIMETDKEWWSGKNEGCCKKGLSVCVDTLFNRNDSEDKFHCCAYWQRRLTNKLSAREFAIKHGVPVPELYWYGKNVADIPFKTIGPKYVIKTSFGTASKDVLVMVDGVNLLDNKPYDEEKIREFFKEKMQKVTPFGYLMIEEFLGSGARNEIAKDYKCHVFGGTVHFIQVIVDRINKLNNWYTREWEEVTKEMDSSMKRGKGVNRPTYLNELISYAEKLGKAYGRKYVRIDFYITGRGCVFGEFTATPSGGFGRSWYGNRVFSRLWKTMENDL